MRLKSIQLENFRSYEKYEHIFDDKNLLTVIVGPNGKGKTNILEAIFVLSLGKSFRTNRAKDLIKWDEDYMRCKGVLEKDNEETELEVFYSEKPKKEKSFKQNKVSMKNSEYVGNLITVLFQPEDLNMLYLSPNLRRKYLNIILSQTDKKYLAALLKYNKVLKQRNILLAQIRDTRFKNKSETHLVEDLDAWDSQLMEFGDEITKKRHKFVEFLNCEAEKIYQKISRNKEKVEIKYSNNVCKNRHPRESEDLPKNYAKTLIQNREKEINYAKTLVGPHRDDLQFFINDKEISHSASRGEFRTLLLAIKLAEPDYIKEQTSQTPIILLDDVFSELDYERQTHLFDAIKDCQVIITTTDSAHIKEVQKNTVRI